MLGPVSGTRRAFQTRPPRSLLEEPPDASPTPSPSEIVLKAEGQIVGEWVGLLEEDGRELIGSNVSGREILLDLGDVSFLDRPAVRVLRQLIRESVGIIHCPPLVEELLTEVTN